MLDLIRNVHSEHKADNVIILAHLPNGWIITFGAAQAPEEWLAYIIIMCSCMLPLGLLLIANLAGLLEANLATADVASH